MTENQKTEKALAALDTMSTIWAAKIGLAGIVQIMLDVPEQHRPQKLIEFIKQAHVEGLFNGFHAGKSLQNSEEWISVKDRLPEDGTEVTVSMQDGRVLQAVKDKCYVGGWKQVNCMSWQCLSMYADDVKFWHPSILPRPPKHGFAKAPEDAPWVKTPA